MPRTVNIEGKEAEVHINEMDSGYMDIVVKTPRSFVKIWIKTHEGGPLYDMVLIQNRRGSTLEEDHHCKISKPKPVNGVASITVRNRTNEKK